MTIVKRLDKGSELTYSELDGNFTDLDDRMVIQEEDDFGWVTVSDSGGDIALTLADTEYKLTNDGLGGQTDLTYGVSGHKNPWNTVTSQIELDDLKVGDRVQFRLNLSTILSGPNRELTTTVNFGIGALVPSVPLFSLVVDNRSYKSQGTKDANIEFSAVIQSVLMKDYPAEITFQSDSTGDSVNVEGVVITSFIR